MFLHLNILGLDSILKMEVSYLVFNLEGCGLPASGDGVLLLDPHRLEIPLIVPAKCFSWYVILGCC